MTYGEYLRLPTLLSSQAPRTGEHDELQFIVVHQVFELWFRLILHEIDAALSRLEARKIRGAARSVDRITRIVRAFPAHVGLLETMRPTDFHRFREALGSSSGLQSEQFREVELASGLGEDPSFLSFLRARGLWTEVQEKRLQMGNLRRGVGRLLEETGASPDEVYARPEEHPDLLGLLEGCLDYDEAFLAYRFAHLQMVERVIGGGAVGTGGMGAPYLRQTLERRFFPELWKSRDRLTLAGGGEITGSGSGGGE